MNAIHTLSPRFPYLKPQQRHKPDGIRVSSVFRSATEQLCCGSYFGQDPHYDWLVALLRFQTPSSAEGKVSHLPITATGNKSQQAKGLLDYV
jgi:hypothetical protein